MTALPEIDPALVRAAQRGDRIAMADLMDALAPYVGRVCGPIALQDGPDAAQEALIAIFRNLGGLHEPGAIYGWARAIAVREAVRMVRKAAGTVPAELDNVPARGDPQLAADVRDVLARLTPEHRAVLVLRDVEGLDERAAGALLDVPAGTIRSRLFRARRSFRKAWLP
ncbi:MAG TPA: RNA polymerase sigma factor [Streptosporangiaceae bacterium]